MKQKIEKIRNKKIVIALMEYLIALGCLITLFVLITPKERITDNAYSYSKPEEVSEYRIENEYMTRIRPLTEYETFKEIAVNTLKNKYNEQYEIKVYSDAEKTEEVIDGNIKSGMVIECSVEDYTREYTANVVGDMTGNGDCEITELSRIIQHFIGAKQITDEGQLLSADISGDGIIDITDIGRCIRYIINDEMPSDKLEPQRPTIEIIGEGNENTGWYRSDVIVKIKENEVPNVEIAKTQTTIEKKLEGEGRATTESTTEKEITLNEAGNYKIGAQSYTAQGIKSEKSEKTVNIDKTVPEIKSLERENINESSCKININAKDNNGIVRYKIRQDNREEENVREVENSAEINESVTITENGIYTVTVEDIAGNITEEKIEIKDLKLEYRVTFKNEDGSVIIEQNYKEGEKLAIPQNPTKAEDETYTYEFSGWTPEIEEEVTRDIEYTATYTKTYKNYTIVFEDEDGEVISQKTDYHYGDEIITPEVELTKEEDETYTYEFSGWTPELENTVSKNETYTAKYDKKYKDYKVTFKNENGEILSEKTDYHYGEKVAIPQDPTKPEDETYTYEFNGWTPEVEETVTENKEYTATYREVYREYTIRFLNEDGTTITQKSDYHYGDEVEIPESPEKQDNETYTYNFIGWTPSIESTVIEDAEYTAVFEQKFVEYQVIFKQDTGEIINSTNYHYNDVLVVPENPSKPSTMENAYTFTGWTPEIEEGSQINITSNLEYTANYEAEKINYTLMFYNDDYDEETGVGTLISSNTYTYGQTITFPKAQKEDTEEIKYVFDSWKNLGVEEVSATQVNIRFKAQYREEYYVARVEEEQDEEGNIVLKGESYLTLQEAIQNAGETARTVRLLRNTEESVIVDDEQNITLNLNGKTITGTRTYAIRTYGEITVVDNTEAKEGKIIAISEEQIGYGIHNRDGKVTIKSGTIAAETSKENGRTYAVYNQSEETLTIEGGSILAEAKGENSVSAGIYNLSGKEIVVKGGLVYGNAIAERSTTYGIYNETEGKVEVTGGNIQAKASLQSATTYGIYNKISQEITISGGTIASQSDKGNAYGVYNEEGKITVTEGKIEVTAYTGYGIYNKGEIEKTAGTVTMIGTTTYGIYNETESNMQLTGGQINSQTSGSNVSGIYNNSTGSLTIQDVIITGGARGIDNLKGNVTITNTNIGAVDGIYTRNNSNTITLESGEITATQNGINNNAGTVIIKEVTINAEKYGVYTTNNGNTEIGIKDNQIKIEKPYINGKDYATYINSTTSGNIRFYDGTLRGPNTIYGGISDIEENSQIITRIDETTNDKITTLQEKIQSDVAKIKETTYRTLAEAVSEVEENKEETTIIEIISNFDISTAVEIPENKNVTIDLAGHNIKAYSKGGIINKGTLEITDSIEETQGTITSEIGIGISNKGKLTITKGKINSNNYGVYNYNNGEAVLQGGTIEAENTGIYSDTNAKEVSIKSGIIKSSNYGIYNGKAYIYVNVGTVNVSGGQIIGNDEGIHNCGYGTINVLEGEIQGGTYGISSTKGTVNVSGGQVISNNKDYYSALYIDDGTLNVTKGTIKGPQGIRYSRSHVTIGIKDQIVDNNNPNIVGEKFGILESLSDLLDFKYYDGKIEGKEEAIYGGITELEENKKVSINKENIDNEEYKVATLVDEEEYEAGIAKIGENTYNTVSSLKQAMQNIQQNAEEAEKVTILNDFEMTQSLGTIKNQNIVIDLNGKTITGITPIINRAKLEITDTTENHEGKIINTITDGIINTGTNELKVTKGTIEGNRDGINNTYENKNVIIGIKDGKVDNELVTIKGNDYSIDNSAYIKINMYDGRLIGYRSAFSESYINETEEGYIAYNYYNQDGYNITELQLETPVAKIGEENYYTLESAINDAQSEETIEILRDIELKNIVIIPQEKEINMDLKGHKISAEIEKMIENNGTLTINNSSNVQGSIKNNKSQGIVIVNNGTLNHNSGTIGRGIYDMAVALQNNGIANISGGSVEGGKYGIENRENSTLTINSGSITGEYAIYNDSINEINIAGGTITVDVAGNSSIRTTYGIYNNADAKINITGGTLKNRRYYNSEYGYGIYNKGNGDILISTTGEILMEKYSYAYPIYNSGEGKVTLEKGTISVKETENLVYGIKNAGRGKIEIKGGEIDVQSTEGVSYGIDNGVSGSIEVTNGSIIAQTTEGTAYGINNMSIENLKITGGKIKAVGTESYGVYNNLSNLIIGENDEEVKTDTPIIESDNVGVYVNDTDTRFNFYDGKIIGKQAMNTDANVPEGYKISKNTDVETGREVAMLVDKDIYIATFYNEDRTQIIAQVPFKSTDTKINEPTPPQKEGYVGLWTEYEIKAENIESQLYYVEARRNGGTYTTEDENGISWNWTYQDGKAIKVYYQSGPLGETVEIPSRLAGYPVENCAYYTSR